jgi:hypothetical protein
MKSTSKQALEGLRSVNVARSAVRAGAPLGVPQMRHVEVVPDHLEIASTSVFVTLPTANGVGA